MEVLWRRTATAVVLLPLEHGEVFELAGTGAALWDVLAEPVTLGEAADALSTAFGTSPEQVAADIEPVLVELARRGVVTERDGAA
ncbi:MAG: PqqD family protein [Acidimicrobiales bacterium]